MEKTMKNLAQAFIGESQARNRYTIYAKIAKKEGYEQISGFFTETAEQEREHAKWLMKMINSLEEKMGGKADLKVEAEVPTVVSDTVSNLKAAIEGENYEHAEMYPSFAAIAEEEGLPEVASRLRSIAKAEAHHEERYLKMAKALEEGAVFEKKDEQAWICRKCGYQHFGTDAPQVCPSCGHPRAYFQIKNELF